MKKTSIFHPDLITIKVGSEMKEDLLALTFLYEKLSPIIITEFSDITIINPFLNIKDYYKKLTFCIDRKISFAISTLDPVQKEIGKYAENLFIKNDIKFEKTTKRKLGFYTLF